MPLRAHLLFDPDADARAHLQADLDPDVRWTWGRDSAPPAQPLDALVGGGMGPEHASWLAPDAHVVVPFAGVPARVLELARAHPNLRLHNLHHNAPIVAETAFALMFAAARAVVPFDRALRRGDWRPRYAPDPAVSLLSATCLVLGYGAIGRRLAALCAAVGMTVHATRRSLTQPAHDGPVRLHPAAALRDLLLRANALLVCLPSTPETRGLLDASALALLPPDAVLVNVARADIIDQDALYHALTTAPLRAALDVWYTYPKTEAERAHTPPARHPFHDLDNVVLSPHRSGHDQHTERHRMRALAATLNAIQRGAPVPHPVNLDAGY